MMNSYNGVKSKSLSVEELTEYANLMRAYALTAIYFAQSGHPGGTLSSMDLVAVAYLSKMKHNPSYPDWEERDRFFFSKAHSSLSLYTALAMSGYYDIKEVMSFRKLNSPFSGHPEMNLLDGVEISGGSLGQGLSVAVGSALAGKIKKIDYNVFCLMGDGEQQEGSIWEAVMSASHLGLDQLIGIIDKNGYQNDGSVIESLNIDPLSEKYKAFGWHVIEIDGHDINQILNAYDKAIETKGKPTVIIAKTVKGKGVSFMENKWEWHSRPPNYQQLIQALKELGCDNFPLDELVKKADNFGKEFELNISELSSYNWNCQNIMRVKIEATRKAFGKALLAIENPLVIKLSADSCQSTFQFPYKPFNFETREGVIDLGIAEQNMTTIAAGLAKEGFVPVIGSYSVFVCGRNWDQLRSTVCAANLNVKIAGVGGITVGSDGASHQALEELFLTTCLPNMKVFIPCDSVETEKMTRKIIEDVKGPCYIRIGKSNSPIVTKESSLLELGTANIIRFRKESEHFPDAFETYLSSIYQSENEKFAIFAYGLMVGEAMRASYILQTLYNIETRVVNMHTIKPLDRKAIEKVAREIDFAIVAEEHQMGGLGNLIAGEIMKIKDRKIKMIEMVGIEDRFGKSGNANELIKYFKLNAENMVKIAREFGL